MASEPTIPAGMKRWAGGDSAPADAGLCCEVLYRNGSLGLANARSILWGRPASKLNPDRIGESSGPPIEQLWIIAYTPTHPPHAGIEQLGEGVGEDRKTLSGRPSLRARLDDATDAHEFERLAMQKAADGERDAQRTIAILRRALAWHGDPQRLATTREEWQQEVDAAIVWVKANPEPDRPSFSTLAALRPSARDGEALADVAAERLRQVEAEGWTRQHDDEHAGGELALAAACYACGRPVERSPWWDIWPWELAAWKPKDRRRDLVRAGALILAEIERLDRAALSADSSEQVAS